MRRGDPTRDGQWALLPSPPSWPPCLAISPVKWVQFDPCLYLEARSEEGSGWVCEGLGGPGSPGLHGRPAWSC